MATRPSPTVRLVAPSDFNTASSFGSAIQKPISIGECDPFAENDPLPPPPVEMPRPPGAPVPCDRTPPPPDPVDPATPGTAGMVEPPPAPTLPTAEGPPNKACWPPEVALLEGTVVPQAP